MNEVYLKELQNIYPALQYFKIVDNTLFFNYKENFKIPFSNTNLNLLKREIFSLDPLTIFQILYLYELIYKKENLEESEKNFIEAYTNRYLFLSDEQTNGDETLGYFVWCLGLPINLAYLEEYKDNPASLIIINTCNNHTFDNISGKNKQPRLVRTNKSAPNLIEFSDYDYSKDLEKAGFATIFLIALAATLTCLYIAFFVVGH